MSKRFSYEEVLSSNPLEIRRAQGGSELTQKEGPPGRPLLVLWKGVSKWKQICWSRVCYLK